MSVKRKKNTLVAVYKNKITEKCRINYNEIRTTAEKNDEA